MQLNRFLWYTLPLLAGLLAKPVQADVSLRIMDNTGGESRIYVSAGRCRFETAGLSGYAIIDTRNQSLVYADPAKSEYSSFTEAQLHEQLDKVDQLRETLSPHMATLNNGLQMLPPQQRAMFEQFMAGKAAPAAGTPIRLMSDHGRQHIAGLACTHYSLLQGNRRTGDACMLEQPDGAVSAADYATLGSVMGVLHELSTRAGGLLARAGNKSVLLQSKISGIPLALRDYTSGESYRVVAANPERIDERLFSGFKGYRQVDSPALGGLF